MSNRKKGRGGRHDNSTEIFQADLFDSVHVQISPEPSISRFVDISRPESKNVVAKLCVKNTKFIFTTRIAVGPLTAATPVSANQTSPCVMSIQCGSIHACQFPYPVEGKAPTIRIARKSGWIEICVPLSTPHDGSHDKHLEGGYSTAFLPLTRDVGMNLCSWNLPLVNFAQLCRMELSA